VGVWGGTYPPLFENMGLVICPNLQTRAYRARERPPVSPDFRVPPHLQTPGSVTDTNVIRGILGSSAVYQKCIVIPVSQLVIQLTVGRLGHVLDDRLSVG